MSDNDLIRRGEVLALLNATSQEEITDECYDRLYDAVALMNPVPQEMSAAEYLKARERMASELTELCSECHCEGKCWSCPYHTPDTEDEMEHPDRSIALVEAWAREHPERSEK